MARSCLLRSGIVPTVVVFLVAAGVLAAGSPAMGSWAYVPLELRMWGADAVVLGKVVQVKPAPAAVEQKASRPMDVAVIAVEQTLKGSDAKTVELLMPSRRAGKGGVCVATSVDIIFRKGQRGIWLLRKDAGFGYYRAAYPSDFQSPEQLPAVKAMLRKLENPHRSQPQGGLVLEAVACNSGRVAPGQRLWLLLAVRNVMKDEQIVLPKVIGPECFSFEILDKAGRVVSRPPSAKLLGVSNRPSGLGVLRIKPGQRRMLPVGVMRQGALRITIPPNLEETCKIAITYTQRKWTPAFHRPTQSSLLHRPSSAAEPAPPPKRPGAAPAVREDGKLRSKPFIGTLRLVVPVVIARQGLS